MTANKYTKNPVKIEATHYTVSLELDEALTSWIDAQNIEYDLVPGDDILTKTLECTMRAHPGNYICSPCKPDIFDETHQEEKE
ncbi:hypothetical protein [Rothia sp. (in: high G+C Gram-positive bacteria)]|uniref:hypothetical protein n=1 Tax=Rothia sp. (in: high G+C Gram-positive bacteria) TaxID=1885016 RepID=UPI000ED7545D|nr:hypothetical protein [Rothia sp. (in: high G+C Gram-positive bacteria)]